MSEEYIRKQDAVEETLKYIISSGVSNQSTWNECVRTITDTLQDMRPADVVQVVRCKDCYHNNDCDIQYTAQAGDSFFCGFGETKEDIRKDLYE